MVVKILSKVTPSIANSGSASNKIQVVCRVFLLWTPAIISVTGFLVLFTISIGFSSTGINLPS